MDMLIIPTNWDMTCKRVSYIDNVELEYRYHMKFQKLAIICTACFLAGCVSNESEVQDPPKLVVVISVDQMRSDFFERFEDQFEGGLKRLWQEGAVYTNAHHAHAPTVTAAGHAALSTGCYPRNNGINNNSLYDRIAGEDLYCVVDTNARIVGVDDDGALPGRSPKRLQVTAIGDWLKAASPESKVFSVARKDRSAVLMGGKNANRAFWYDNLSSKMISSDYYSDPYPAWADSIVGTEELADFLKAGWEKKMPKAAYATLRADDFDAESGAFAADYPHNRDRMRPGYPDATKDLIMMIYTPMADGFTIDFAQTLIEEEGLGSGPQTDMLMIGCSAADAIGHHFGPESHEVLDYYLYLDSYLEDLFATLDQQIGRDAYWVVLSSDHGVAPLPEAMRGEEPYGQRVISGSFVTMADSIETLVKSEFGLNETLFEKLSGGVYINYAESDSMGLDRKNIRSTVASQFIKLDFIADAFTSDELESDVDRPFVDYYRNAYIPVLSPDVLLRKTEFTLIHGATGTSHGSPYTYDTQVPVVFLGTPFKAAKYDRRTETVDMAPTLAVLLGCQPDKELDGTELEELIVE